MITGRNCEYSLISYRTFVFEILTCVWHQRKRKDWSLVSPSAYHFLSVLVWVTLVIQKALEVSVLVCRVAKSPTKRK